ncbi:CD1375 family protein [Paenibacillus agricola]|nr:CD1375 family protein [Paenibacillus agricola]
MATVYYKLIKAGKKVIGDVPENLRPDVKALLDADA